MPEGKRPFGRPWTRRDVSKLLRPNETVVLTGLIKLRIRSRGGLL
jgi:hypothetical protein